MRVGPRATLTCRGLTEKEQPAIETEEALPVWQEESPECVVCQKLSG